VFLFLLLSSPFHLFLTVPLPDFFCLQLYILQTFHRLQITVDWHTLIYSLYNPRKKAESSVTLLIQKHGQVRQTLFNNYALINCNKTTVLFPLFVQNVCSIALRFLV